jgi:hypothetical protein
MYRRKVTVAAIAVFAIGVAFAAEPTSERSAWSMSGAQQRTPWVPGANMLMSAHEPTFGFLAPPP